MKRSIYACLNHALMVFVLIVFSVMNASVIQDGRAEIAIVILMIVKKIHAQMMVHASI